VPVTPCRAVDTRIAGGRIAAGGSRGFDVFGTSSFAGQGGDTGGCGVPSYASAVAINLISTQPLGTGYLRGGPQNTGGTPTAPDATLLSFATGPNRSNEVPVTTCRPFFLTSCVGNDEIRIFSFQSATHVV